MERIAINVKARFLGDWSYHVLSDIASKCIQFLVWVRQKKLSDRHPDGLHGWIVIVWEKGVSG